MRSADQGGEDTAVAEATAPVTGVSQIATCPHTVHVRDSKLSPRGPHVSVPAHVWAAFLSYAAGEA
ncbi:hypothetical protein C3489_24740 [Streptomyces sp. Ru71]|nr:hypothetical protein C3489_24740 [Streptomyces sp. Ru71]